MNEVLGHVFGVVLTPWKLVGYLGVFLFAGRWVVQVAAARRHQRPVVPRLFWTLSMAGSALLLAYFTFGRNDSIGVLSNLFPMAVAFYNLWLDVRARHDPTTAPRTQARPAEAHRLRNSVRYVKFPRTSR